MKTNLEHNTPDQYNVQIIVYRETSTSISFHRENLERARDRTLKPRIQAASVKKNVEKVIQIQHERPTINHKKNV